MLLVALRRDIIVQMQSVCFQVEVLRHELRTGEFGFRSYLEMARNWSGQRN